MGDVQMLMEMGFPKEKAEYAVKITNNAGVEPAMEWLLAHVDEEVPKMNEMSEQAETPAADQEQATGSATASQTGDEQAEQATPTAKGLKCDDCGKLLKDQLEAEYHAVRTTHKNFSESTEEKPPLTEEEKREQLQLIEEKLRLKRLEREERERQDELERERNRIRSGKDMTEARKRLEHLEMQKIVEQRKREKAEEKAARERVRAQIEADKAARKAKSQSSEVASSAAVTSTTTATVAATTSGASKKDYTHTRIQIRLQDGTTLTETFAVKEQLSAVRVFIQMKTGAVTPFALMTTFPRKTFADEDYEKPLEALGLVPSAVIIMTKANA